jgi:hypothetical protein
LSSALPSDIRTTITVSTGSAAQKALRRCSQMVWILEDSFIKKGTAVAVPFL